MLDEEGKKRREFRRWAAAIRKVIEDREPVELKSPVAELLILKLLEDPKINELIEATYQRGLSETVYQMAADMKVLDWVGKDVSDAKIQAQIKYQSVAIPNSLTADSSKHLLKALAELYDVAGHDE